MDVNVLGVSEMLYQGVKELGFGCGDNNVHVLDIVAYLVSNWNR